MFGCYPLGEKLLWNRSITAMGPAILMWQFLPGANQLSQWIQTLRTLLCFYWTEEGFWPDFADIKHDYTQEFYRSCPSFISQSLWIQLVETLYFSILISRAETFRGRYCTYPKQIRAFTWIRLPCDKCLPRALLLLFHRNLCAHLHPGVR